MRFDTPSIRAAAAVAALALLAGRVDAASFVSISASPPLAAGATFSLWLEDSSIPSTGFTDADVLVEFDPAVLAYRGALVDSRFAFGPASLAVQAIDFKDDKDDQSWMLFTITRDASQPGQAPASYGSEVLRVDFQVLPGNRASSTVVNFYPAYDIKATGYYRFAALGAQFGVSPVPEPAAAALLLAGLAGLGAAVRRRPG